MTTVNWNQLMENAGSGFDPLPASTYDVVVDSVEPKTASTGKLMFAAALKVASGPHAGRRIWTNYVVNPENPNALGYFFANMAAYGLTKEFFAQSPTPEQVAAALQGRSARVEVAQKTYQGTLRNEVKKTMPAGAVIAAPVTTPAPGIPQVAPAVTPQPAPVAAPVVTQQPAVAEPVQPPPVDMSNVIQMPSSTAAATTAQEAHPSTGGDAPAPPPVPF